MPASYSARETTPRNEFSEKLEGGRITEKNRIFTKFSLQRHNFKGISLLFLPISWSLKLLTFLQCVLGFLRLKAAGTNTTCQILTALLQFI